MSNELSDDLILEAAKIPAATLHEAAGKIGALPSYLKPIAKGMKLCGRAFTIQGPSGCNLWLHRALAKAPPGDVLIADVGRDPEYGYWGDIMGTAALSRGLKGLLIDGCVRDAVELEEMNFPVFSAGLCIRGTDKLFDGNGALNEPITIDDITVNPGDLVLGDDDGLAVIPAGQVADTITKAHAREAKEDDVKERLRAGETTLEIYGWD